MRRTWLGLGVVVFVVCFSAGVVMSRTGLEWWLPSQQGPLGAEGDPSQGLETSELMPGTLGGAGQTPPEGTMPWNSAPPSPPPAAHDPAAAPGLAGPPRDPQRGLPGVPPEVRLDWEKLERRDGAYVIPLDDGGEAVLTLNVEVQDHMSALYGRYGLPHASFVAIEPKTGRVLALAQHESSADPVGHPALKAFAPSASVFKTVTAAALIEERGLKPNTRVCFQGETSKDLSDEQILGIRDGSNVRCSTFARAFGESNNPVFANLAYANLSRDSLERWAAKMGYGETFPIGLDMEASRVDLPQDPLERARAAAGFGHTHLTPFHAAVMSAGIANGGVVMRPSLIQEIRDAQGNTTYRFSPIPYKRIVEPDTARMLADMMVHTTTVGTGRKYFHQAQGLTTKGGAFTVGGKSGTLSRRSPYLLFSWFVGLAPVEHPEFAFAALVCNPMKWKIKGGYAALEGVRAFVRTRAEAAPEPAGLLPEDGAEPFGEAGQEDALDPSQDQASDAVINPDDAP